MMKRILLALMAAMAWCGLYADDCQIPVALKMADSSADLPQATINTLRSTVNQALERNGFVGSDGKAAFCVTLSVDELSHDLIGGMRPTVTVALDVNLSLTNTITGEQFSSETITLHGAGHTDEAAYKKACRQLKPTDRALTQYVASSAKRVQDYYSSQLNNIFSSVDALMVQRDYEKAMWMLNGIPSCVKGYDKVVKKMTAVFQGYIDLDCSQKLTKAEALWAAKQNREGALQALALLAGIDPQADCGNGADNLFKEIYEKVKEDNAYDQKLQEEIADFYREMRRAEVDNEKARIEAMRAIGKAYGENQQEQNLIINK